MKTIAKTALSEQKNLTNDILKTIYERRAIRQYKDKSVEKETIEQLIDAGRMAPSAINKQPWKFYVLTNKEDIKAFSKEIATAAFKGVVKSGIKGIIKTTKEFLHFSHGADFFKAPDAVFHGAPVVIFITAPKDNEWAGLDIGMCSQNIMLAAKSLGLDSCPVGFGKFVEHTEIYSRLNIPASEQVMLSVIIGYGNEKPEIHERVKNNIVYI